MTEAWNRQFLLEKPALTPQDEDDLVQYYIETYLFAESSILMVMDKPEDRFKLVNVAKKSYDKHKLLLTMFEGKNGDWAFVVGKIDDFADNGFITCSKEDFAKTVEGFDNYQDRQDYLNNLLKEFVHV